MKLIPVGKGKHAMVDDFVFDLVGDQSWYLHKYVQRNFYVMGKAKPALLHRVIMDAPKGVEVDHIDGDKLNNQLSNLRLCSHQQNQHNRRFLNKNNTSGFKGVFFDKRRGAWYCQIKVNGKQRTIAAGFLTAKEASLAYDLASIAEFGEFSATNAVVGGKMLPVQ